jgi:hypothetical protein
MSATVNFNTASHIWCCEEHDVLGQSYTSSLVWDIAMAPYKWFYRVSCAWVHLSCFCAHPKVLFHVTLVWPVPLTQVFSHLQLIFPSKTWFFGIYLNFQWQKSFKNQYLPHSESKSYQINSIKLCSSRYFQQHQRHIPILLKFSATIIFSEEIIQYSRTFGPQVQTSWNQAHAPLLVETFERHQEHVLKHPGLVDLITTKQNKLLSFIDR